MELLIRRYDKVNADPEKDFYCLKSGDIVATCPDGWRWGLRELDNPAWRIVRLTEMPLAWATVLSEPAVDEETEEIKTIRRYALVVDPDLSTEEFNNFWNDDSRVNAIFETRAATQNINEFIRLR